MKVNCTSALVKGLPSWNFTPERRRKVTVLPSSEMFQDSARLGSGFRSNHIRANRHRSSRQPAPRDWRSRYRSQRRRLGLGDLNQRAAALLGEGRAGGQAQRAHANAGNESKTSDKAHHKSPCEPERPPGITGQLSERMSLRQLRRSYHCSFSICYARCAWNGVAREICQHPETARDHGNRLA